MTSKNQQGGMDVTQNNVFRKPLHKHSVSSTSNSSLRSGYCTQSLPIAGILTNAFLNQSSSKDLRKQGFTEGQRYCIDATQWKAVVDAAAKDKDGDIPRVKLECTHEKALDTVGLDMLKRYKAVQDVDRGVERPGDGGFGKGGGVVRESGDIGGKEPRA